MPLNLVKNLGHLRFFFPSSASIGIGDFLYLHTKNLYAFGIVIRASTFQHADPLSDIFEIVDLSGRVVWGRLGNVKFYYPSLFTQSHFARKSLDSTIGSTRDSAGASDMKRTFWNASAKTGELHELAKKKEEEEGLVGASGTVREMHTFLRSLFPSRHSLHLPNQAKQQVEEWACSLGDQVTFNLWDAYIATFGSDPFSFCNLFLLFRYMYEQSVKIIRDSTYRINGPFTYRKKSQMQLLERCNRLLEGDNWNGVERLARFKTWLNASRRRDGAVDRDLLDGMCAFAFSTFENQLNNPFEEIGKRLMIDRDVKGSIGMQDYMRVKGLLPELFNPRLAESNLELEHDYVISEILNESLDEKMIKNTVQPTNSLDKKCHKAAIDKDSSSLHSPTDTSHSHLPAFHNSHNAPSLKFNINSTLNEYRYNEKIRTEYKSSPVFTIDSDRASEIDDGISVDTDPTSTSTSTWFHVHIADCLSFFNFNDPIDRIGRRMATSVYLPERTFPMLPWHLTKEMSLEPDKPTNFCITFSFTLASDGNISQYKITPTSIPGSLIQKLSYSNIDINAPYLSRIHAACKNHYDYRQRQGLVDIDLPQPQIYVSMSATNGSKNVHFDYRPKDEMSQAERDGHFIVSEMMIMAGRVASLFSLQHHIPIPFRFQQINPAWTPTQLQSFFSSTSTSTSTTTTTATKSKEEKLVDAFLYSRTAIPAQYGPEPQRHISMGLSCYAKVTSPIRRYVDILTHHQIKSFIMQTSTSSTVLTGTELVPIINYINDRELRTKWLQRHSTKYWIVQYIHHQHQCQLQNQNQNQLQTSNNKQLILSGTVVRYDEMTRLYHIFLDYWNISTVYRTDSDGGVSLDVGMRVDMQIEEIYPMQSYIKITILKRYF